MNVLNNELPDKCSLKFQKHDHRCRRVVTLAPNIADTISVAIYVRHGTKVDIKNVLRHAMRGRSNIGVHLVHESGVGVLIFLISV